MLGVLGYNDARLGNPSEQDGYPDPTAQDIYVSSSLRLFFFLNISSEHIHVEMPMPYFQCILIIDLSD